MTRAEKFSWFTRLGFASRGLTYILLGYFAAKAAFASGEIESRTGLLGNMTETPLEMVLLAVIALGLVGYGAWRLSGAAFDLNNHGDDTKGIAVRFGHSLSGFAHVGLGLYAFVMLLGASSGSGGQSSSEQGASWLLRQSWGEYALYAIAAGFVVTGLFQFVKAYRLKFLETLSGRARTSSRVKWLGRLGYCARAIVFSTIGYLTYRAAVSGQGSDAGGMAGALKELQSQSTGPWLLGLTAIGLLFFGVFSIVEARYRELDSEDVAARLNSAG